MGLHSMPEGNNVCKKYSKISSLWHWREKVLTYLFIYFTFFWDRVSLSCSFGFPTIHSVDQAGLQITEIYPPLPISAGRHPARFYLLVPQKISLFWERGFWAKIQKWLKLVLCLREKCLRMQPMQKFCGWKCLFSGSRNSEKTLKKIHWNLQWLQYD